MRKDRMARAAAALVSGSLLLSALPSVPSAVMNTKAANDEYIFHDDFESSTGDWEGRGAASVGKSSNAYSGSGAMLVSGRTDTWNGAQKALSSSSFTAGEEYSISAYVSCTSSKSVELMLSLQYKDGTETKYDHLATVDSIPDGFVQLANKNYKIPDGATDLSLYVETVSGTGDLIIDDVIAASAGTEISIVGVAPPVLGDITRDGVIDALDVAVSRDGLINGISDKTAAKLADVDKNKKFETADLVLLQEYVLGKISEFPVVEPEEPEPGERLYSTEEFTEMIASQVKNSEPNDSHMEKSGVQYGTIKKGSYYSSTCKREKPYMILLPANYDEDKTYPVLYVMHGYWEKETRMITEGNGQMYTRQIIGNAIAEGEAKDMIVVFPYIYSSATQAECSGMDDANNAAYDNFINDLTKDLMPHIEENYSIKTGRENTAITGFSMGGRESLLIGMQRPDLFGYVGAICPAPGVTGTFNWSSDEMPYILFITAGSNDDVVYTTPSGYHDNFTKNGVPHVWHYVQGGAHGDNSIHPHLYNFVRAVFQATT